MSRGSPGLTFSRFFGHWKEIEFRWISDDFRGGGAQIPSRARVGGNYMVWGPDEQLITADSRQKSVILELTTANKQLLLKLLLLISNWNQSPHPGAPKWTQVTAMWARLLSFCELFLGSGGVFCSTTRLHVGSRQMEMNLVPDVCQIWAKVPHTLVTLWLLFLSPCMNWQSCG